MFKKKELLGCISLISLAVCPIIVQAAKYVTAKETDLEWTSTKPTGGFELNIGPVWLRPGASNLNYVIFNKELPALSPSWEEKEINTSYTTGVELMLGYRFPNIKGKEITLDWTHVSTSNSEAISAPNFNFFLGPDYEIGPAGLPIRHATGKAKFKFDVINLSLDQIFSYSPDMELRLFGGLSTGFLREEVIAVYSGNILTGDDAGPFSMTQDVNSKFSGVGPRFGIQANYTTSYGFGLLGEAAASALIGHLDSKTAFTGTSQELLAAGIGVNHQTIKDQHVAQVIPGFSMKIGVDYEHAFNKDFLFTLAVGYEAAVYINAISQYLPASLVLDEPLQTGGIFVATMSHTLSNYSVQGPFLNFGFKVI